MPIADFVTSISGLAGTVGIESLLQRRVERAFLQNLSTGRTAQFLLNPAAFTETYKATYKRHGSIGLSHERMQFTGNPNAVIPIEVFYDQLIAEQRKSRAGGVTRRGQEKRHTSRPNDAEIWRRFLISLVYPRRSNILKGASPAPVLFHWPGMISMRVRVLEVKFAHVLFETGLPRARAYTASIMLEEEAQERIYSDDILNTGTFRPWAASNSARGG